MNAPSSSDSWKLHRKITCDVVALLHEFHFANRLILLHFVSFVWRFTVCFIVGVANIWALGVIVTRSHQRVVTHSNGLVERLKSRKEKIIRCDISFHTLLSWFKHLAWGWTTEPSLIPYEKGRQIRDIIWMMKKLLKFLERSSLSSTYSPWLSRHNQLITFYTKSDLQSNFQHSFAKK